MPQEKPVRDFMGTIGTFYELIEEKSPFDDEKKKYELTNGDSHVIQADLEMCKLFFFHRQMNRVE